MDPKMLAAFKDGTKTMVEMAACPTRLACPDVPGMMGKVAGPKQVLSQRKMVAFHRRGCVDYSIGKVAPGVFAIIATDEPRIIEDMKFYSMGYGPYYLLYRPTTCAASKRPFRRRKRSPARKHPG
jgi:predicted homoserine dehydrogenase-like protein